MLLEITDKFGRTAYPDANRKTIKEIAADGIKLDGGMIVSASGRYHDPKTTRVASLQPTR